MPGAKRKIDEDTWIVSQSKKFKDGMLLSNVYDTTLAHLRMGARNFFDSLMMRSGSRNGDGNAPSSSSPQSSHSSTTGGNGSTSPIRSPPGSPLVRDIISDNELQTVGSSVIARPGVICQECTFRYRSPLGSEDSYGKCAYCDKLVCHLNSCRGCENVFCGGCSIPKYDNSNSETYECYGCLH